MGSNDDGLLLSAASLHPWGSSAEVAPSHWAPGHHFSRGISVALESKMQAAQQRRHAHWLEARGTGQEQMPGVRGPVTPGWMGKQCA